MLNVEKGSNLTESMLLHIKDHRSILTGYTCQPSFQPPAPRRAAALSWGPSLQMTFRFTLAKTHRTTRESRSTKSSDSLLA